MISCNDMMHIYHAMIHLRDYAMTKCNDTDGDNNAKVHRSKVYHIIEHDVVKYYH